MALRRKITYFQFHEGIHRSFFFFFNLVASIQLKFVIKDQTLFSISYTISFTCWLCPRKCNIPSMTNASLTIVSLQEWDGKTE